MTDLTDIPSEDYQRIVSLIESDASPVGIDAKHTHVIIIKLLQDIDSRLRSVEARLTSEGK